MNKSNYGWFRSPDQSRTNQLFRDNELVASITYVAGKSTRAYLEIDRHRLIIERENRIFSSSIVVRDEETGNRICIIKNMKWYAFAKGLISFEDGTNYIWQISNHPNVTFSIRNAENSIVTEYMLNETNDRFNIIVEEEMNEKSIFHLLLSIGWYCAPRLDTVDYTSPQLITQNLEYAI